MWLFLSVIALLAVLIIPRKFRISDSVRRKNEQTEANRIEDQPVIQALSIKILSAPPKKRAKILEQVRAQYADRFKIDGGSYEDGPIASLTIQRVRT